MKTSVGGDADIDKVLRIETPDNTFFNEKGIYNYHGGANAVSYTHLTLPTTSRV